MGALEFFLRVLYSFKGTNHTEPTDTDPKITFAAPLVKRGDGPAFDDRI